MAGDVRIFIDEWPHHHARWPVGWCRRRHPHRLYVHRPDVLHRHTDISRPVGHPHRGPEGDATIYVNDTTDADGDGLGQVLETAIGTCWSTTTSCPYAATPGDTDRDGLPDGEELLGFVGPDPDGSEDIGFPRYGADPNHKDVFLAVTWLTDIDPDEPERNPFVVPTLAPGTTALDWVQQVRSAYLAGPNSHLHNPDWQAGVELHFDIGVTPSTPADEALYGIWSEDIVHGITPAFIIEFTNTVDGDVYVSINGEWVTVDGSGLDILNLAASVGLSILSLGEPGTVTAFDVEENANQEVVRVTLVVDTSEPGEHFGRDLLAIADPEGVAVLEEEDAPLRAHVDDPDYYPPALRNRSRYAVMIGTGGGGNADSPFGRLVSGLNAETLGHELGHTIGLRHYGHDHWLFYTPGGGTPADTNVRDTEFNCSPHYYSTMNYAFDQDAAHYRFSDEQDMIMLNPSHVAETNSFPGMVTARFAGFAVFPRHRRRQRRLEPQRHTGRQYERRIQRPLRLARNQDCRFVQRRAPGLGGRLHRGATDLIRVGSRVYAFYAVADDADDDAGEVFYRFATLGTVGNASCSGPDNPLDYDPDDPQNATTGCLSWSNAASLGFESKGLSAAWWQSNVFLASLSSSDGLDLRRFTVGASGTLTQAYQLQVAAGSNRGRPELAVLYASPLANAGWTERLVAVRNAISTSEYRAYYWSGSSFVYWSDFRLAENADGSADLLTGAGDAALVAWPDPFNTAVDAEDRVTCGIFPNDDRGMRPYCFDPVDLVWRDLSDEVFWSLAISDCPNNEVLDAEAGLAGRCLVRTATPPSLAMRYVRGQSGAPISLSSASSHFQLTWSHVTPGAPFVWISDPLSLTNHPLAGAWAFDRWRVYFANEWHIADAGASVPLYEDSTLGGLFALGTREQTVRFYPHADGSADVDLWVGSDFRVMEDYVCRWVAGDPPVACGDVNVFE
jgi:hypothetical protein